MPRGEPEKIKSAPRIFFVGFVVVVSCLLIYFAIMSQYRNPTVSIRGSRVNVKIATTSQEKSIGLCCRDSLGQNDGMLFIYDDSGDYRFWMKDTRIPLDMIWISSAKKVVHFEQNVQPSSYPKTFRSPVYAKYILETNSGWVEKKSIQKGDGVIF